MLEGKWGQGACSLRKFVLSGMGRSNREKKQLQLLAELPKSWEGRWGSPTGPPPAWSLSVEHNFQSVSSLVTCVLFNRYVSQYTYTLCENAEKSS